MNHEDLKETLVFLWGQTLPLGVYNTMAFTVEMILGIKAKNVMDEYLVQKSDWIFPLELYSFNQVWEEMLAVSRES